MSCFTNTICQYFKKHYLCNYNINSLFHIKMKLCIRHITTLIIASLISFTANADISHPARRNFSNVFASNTNRYQYLSIKEPTNNSKSEINREQFNNARKEYWKNEYPEKQTK